MKKESSGGIDLLGVLQIIFIVLKCAGLVDWSWWLVLTPLWINLGLIVILIIAILTDRDQDY